MPDFVNDQFATAADTPIAGHAPDIGGAWTIFGGGVSVIAASGTASFSTVTGDNGALNMAVPPSADYTVAVTVANKITGKIAPQVYARSTIASGAIADCYFAFCNDNTVFLGKKKAGNYTFLTQASRALVVGDVLAIKVAGTSIIVTVNGTTVITTTDAQITAAGYAGFAGNGGNVDNFRAYTNEAAGPITGASTPSIGIVSNTATGKLYVRGISQPTLDNVLASGFGTIGANTAVADLTLNNVSVNSTATVPISGTSNRSIDSVLLTSNGQITNKATASITVDSVGTESQASIGIKGFSNTSLGYIQVNAYSSNLVAIAGSSNTTIGNVTTVANGRLTTKITTSITLGAVLASGAGSLVGSGRVTKTLNNVTVVSQAKVTVKSSTAINIDSFKATINTYTPLLGIEGSSFIQINNVGHKVRLVKKLMSPPTGVRNPFSNRGRYY